MPEALINNDKDLVIKILWQLLTQESIKNQKKALESKYQTIKSKRYWKKLIWSKKVKNGWIY